MANQFIKRVEQNVGTTPVIVYATGPTTRATIIGINIANTITNSISVSIKLQDETSTEIFIVKDTPIPARAALAAIGGDQKLVMEPNNSLIIYSNQATSADVIVSALEIV